MSEPTGLAENWATLWEAIAVRQPADVAVVVGDRHITWASLDGRASRLATALTCSGIQPGGKVAQMMYNCPEYLESAYAAFKVRASTVNVNYRYRAPEVVHIVDDSDAEVLVYHHSFAGVVEEARRSLPKLRLLVEVEDPGAPLEGGADGPHVQGASRYEDLIAANSPVTPIARSGNDELLLYTGGTTGRPKGVVWRHADLFWAMAFNGYAAQGLPVPDTPEEVGLVAAELRRAGSSPVNMTAPPLMHGTALFLAMSTFVMGGTVVLLAGRHFDPVELLQLVERERVTQLSIVGDAFARPIVAELQRADEAGEPYDLSSLTRIVSTGATLSAVHKQQLMQRATNASVLDMVGASEGGPFAMAITPPGADPIATAQFVSTPVTTVFDPETWERIEPGSGRSGVLAASGPIPLGYYKDPVKTASTFREIGGVRYSVPGDHAMVDADGIVHLLGRGSVCINTGGEKVFPEEVEVVARQLAGIEDCLAVGVADDRFGEIVVLVASRTPEATVEPAAVIDHVKRHLAAYKAPRDVVFVEHFYRSPSGKADYRWARDVASRALGRSGSVERGAGAPIGTVHG